MRAMRPCFFAVPSFLKGRCAGFFLCFKLGPGLKPGPATVTTRMPGCRYGELVQFGIHKSKRICVNTVRWYVFVRERITIIIFL